MGSFDLIKTEVKARLGNRTDVEARLGTWINDAYFELLLSPRFSFFELDQRDDLLTVAGTREYDTPMGRWLVLSVRDVTNKRRIRKTHWKVIDDLDENVLGLPIRYARYGMKIEFDPTPDAEYAIKMRTRTRPPELTVGSSHLLGREWDEILTLLATVKGYQALEQQSKALNERRLVEALMGVHEEAESLEDMDMEATIGVRL